MNEAKKAGSPNRKSTPHTSSSLASPSPDPTAERLDVMLTKKELAKRLKVTVRTVENYQRRGIVPFVKVGKIVLFHWPEIVEYLKTHFRGCPAK